MKEEKSRTQYKKEALYLQALGEKLVGLGDDQVKGMNLPEELFDAVVFAKGIKKHGALRRQLQYIGSLMRLVDPEPIEHKILEIEQGAHQKAIHFQKIEKWRDGLIAGNNVLMEKIINAHPEVDRRRLGQLVRSARREKTKNAPPKSSRNLFRYLKEISDANIDV